MQYTCGMCKGLFVGEPAFKNNAGTFCATCKATIHKRAAEAVRGRPGFCHWCGGAITPETAMPGKEYEQVCKQCESRRSWLLACIRYGPRAARYAASREEREGPLRDARANLPASLEKDPIARDRMDRLGAIENLVSDLALKVNHLMRELGA